MCEFHTVYSIQSIKFNEVFSILFFYQVISVIKRHPSVQKISVIGHSLGGLVARYAIAKLYERDISKEIPQENGHCGDHNSDPACHGKKAERKIAGLEPLNFITSATPHLGSRGHKQVVLLVHFDLFSVLAISLCL